MGTSFNGDRPWQSYNTAYTNAKAGMDGVDKEKVQRVIYEMSKGSKYFESEKRKEAFIKQKVENLQAQRAKLTDKEISHFQQICDKKIVDLEASRDLSKIWLHTDMDAFYAAVETLANPSLRGKPLAVGGLSMISTANYEARKFGVRAAMPGFIARKLCPDLIFVPPDFEKYTYYSDLIRKVFRKYDPDFIPMGLDEAYLNITETCHKRDINREEVANELRNSIYEETGLTCSAGVAPNRLLAKVCSDINKPNGQFILPNDRNAVMTFISTLPIRKIGGIGKVTEHVLRDVLGINTCQEMLQKGALLCALFSQCSTDFFLSVGLGMGGTNTPQPKSRKSISIERTFSATEEESNLFEKLADIAETLSKDMQKECLCGRTLSLKLKTATFEVRNRAVSLQRYIHSKEDIPSYASKLLKAELPLSLRLMGLRMSQFRDDNLDPMQKTLTSFVILGEDATKSFTCTAKSTGLEMSDKHILNDGELDSSIGDVSYFSNDTCSVPREVEYFLSNHLEHNASNDACGVKGVDNALSVKSDPNNSEKNETVHFSEGEAAQLSRQKVKPLWIDDYICALCGIELPTSFTEERQEHADYHLAEMLQKEESTKKTRHQMQHERLVEKLKKSGESSRKRQKLYPKEEKHIPIESFFIKKSL